MKGYEEDNEKKKKSLALKASTSHDDDDDSHEEKDKDITLLSKKFKKFLQRKLGNRKSFKKDKKEASKKEKRDSNKKNPIIYYKCKKLDYTISKCPQLKKLKKKLKKNAVKATCDDKSFVILT